MDEKSATALPSSHDATNTTTATSLPVLDLPAEKETTAGSSTAVSRSSLDNHEKPREGLGAEDTTTKAGGEPGDEVEDESKYPKGLKLGLITLALALAVFLFALVRRTRCTRG